MGSDRFSNELKTTLGTRSLASMSKSLRSSCSERSGSQVCAPIRANNASSSSSSSAFGVATSVTGFPPFFRFEKLLPSHVVGVISLVVLALAVYARYPAALAGGWSTTYVVAAVIAQYLNVFVLVVQLFLKVSALKALAATQKEAPFKIAQSVVLLAFTAGGWIATTSFAPTTVAAVASP